MWIYFSSKEANDWPESWISLLICKDGKDKQWPFKLSHVVWKNVAINPKSKREKPDTPCCSDQQKYCPQCLVKTSRSDLTLLGKSARKAETKKLLQSVSGRGISHNIISMSPHVNARTLRKLGPWFPAAVFWFVLLLFGCLFSCGFVWVFFLKRSRSTLHQS